MNLTDDLKQQLGGEVAKTLGGMAGVSEGDLTKIIESALPGLLTGLGSLATSKEGAGKLAESIGGMDSTLFGNVADMLGGQMATQGGSMLGKLFGAGLVDNIAAAISKRTGVNHGIVKMILGYITPIIMGCIGKKLGGKPDAASISRLFAEQKPSIAAAVPSGLSLGNIQGFSTLANPQKESSRPSTRKEFSSNGALGKLLAPVVAFVLLLGGYFYWNSNKQAAEILERDASTAMKDAGDAAASMVEHSKDLATGALENAVRTTQGTIGNLTNFNIDSFKSDFTGMFDALTGKLGKITDATGADDALPDLKGYASKLDGLTKTVSALPPDGKVMVVELIRSQMIAINPILEKITGIPGTGETVLQVIGQIKDKLAALAI
ncbi:MAG: DUF937 domain-containing protein [Pirellulaceae bacterium]|nr:DUF937 domain-containing protein [Pirellulaceae bacterium]